MKPCAAFEGSGSRWAQIKDFSSPPRQTPKLLEERRESGGKRKVERRRRDEWKTFVQ